MKLMSKTETRPLSNKEFLLISVLVLMGVAYLSYNYLILPKFNEYSIASDKIETSRKCCQILKKQYENITKLKQDEMNLKYKLQKLEQQMPPYISQEDIILTLGKYAEECKIIIQSMSLDNEKSTSANNLAVSSSQKKDIEEQFKDKDSQENSGYSAKVLTKYVNLSFNGNITSLYNFIDKLENNETKIFVKDISLNKSEDVLLSGNMKLQYWAYKDKNSNSSKDLKINVPKINGKDNPFKPYDGYEGSSSSNGKIPIKTYEPNFLIQLKKPTDSGPKFIMSEYKKQETEIYSSINGNINGKLTISKKDDKYMYTYKLGESIKTEEKSMNFYNGIIRVSVDSHFRNSSNDNMSINMDVENKTDLALEVTVNNDDERKPLFKLGNKVGKVFLKQVSK